MSSSKIPKISSTSTNSGSGSEYGAIRELTIQREGTIKDSTSVRLYKKLRYIFYPVRMQTVPFNRYTINKSDHFQGLRSTSYKDMKASI